jgi:phosphoribosylanthranilate isomerase
MPVRVKICGLSTEATIGASVEAGAAYVGFVFFPKSPRAVTPQQAALLSAAVPLSVKKVALVVDVDDTLLDEIAATLAPDLWQLHGAETPARAAAIRARTGRPVMKALAIATSADLEAARAFEPVVDQFLFDAKPPPGGLPGGNGLPFDWRLLKGTSWSVPWMLSGGLTAENVAEAVAATGATQIDLSSGVEDAPGVKSPEKIRRLLAAVHAV